MGKAQISPREEAIKISLSQFAVRLASPLRRDAVYGKSLTHVKDEQTPPDLLSHTRVFYGVSLSTVIGDFFFPLQPFLVLLGSGICLFFWGV